MEGRLSNAQNVVEDRFLGLIDNIREQRQRLAFALLLAETAFHKPKPESEDHS